MPSIKIFNTMIVIEDYEKNEQNQVLERVLTNFDKRIFQITFTAFRVVTNPDTGKMNLIIPRNFSINWLSGLFPKHEVKYINCKDSEKKIDFKMKFKPKDDQQELALDWLEKQSKYSQKLLSLRTDSGKTYLALNYICGKKYFAMIVVDSINILTQWKERISQLTTIKDNEIFIIRGKSSFKQLWKNHKRYKIIIAVHRTLNKQIERDPSSLNKLFKHIDLGVKVVDEAHSYLSSVVDIELATNIPDSLYLTATPERTEWKENKILCCTIPVNYAHGVKEKLDQDERYHRVYQYTYDTNCDPLRAIKMKTRFGFNINIWSKYTVEKEPWSVISKVMIKYVNYCNEKLDCSKIAIMLSTHEQCEKAYDLLCETFEEDQIGLFTTQTDALYRAEQLNKAVFVTTEKSFGKAIDTDIDALLLFIPLSSSPVCKQILGRLRKRGKAVLMDFTDNSIPKAVASMERRRVIFDNIAKVIHEREVKI